MHVVPYLNFDGDCAEAFAFYAGLLGGKVEELHRFGGSPAEAMVTEDWLDKVMHARLRAGDIELFGCDSPPQFWQVGGPQGFNVALQVADIDEGRRVFDALSEGGEVSMPFEKTFWSPGFGMATDRYGTPWMVNVLAES